MRFVDEVTVTVVGGKGGDGSVHWRREKFVPRGGPDGGDGGNGGAVIFVADPDLNTLIDYSFQPIRKAAPGNAGDENNRTGRSAPHLFCKVPVGTQVFLDDSLIADLNQPHAHWIAARGGVGGKGNAFFKSPTRQAPDFAQPGQPGEEYSFRLVLKSIADIGIIGFPNAGKSTLISRITSSAPKIAAYPFTTLEPNLGVLMYDDGRRLVLADIPGLISGAHQGKGLGIDFLRHVERTSALLHIIDPSSNSRIAEAAASAEGCSEALLLEQCLADIETIANELRSYSSELESLPRLLAVSKSDVPINQRAAELLRTKIGTTLLCFSSQNAEGLQELTEELWALTRGKTS